MSLWYVEVREAAHTKALSLDLARHLTCRLLVGPVAILDERPGVLAAVLGKRWVTIVHEIERAYSSTLRAPRRKELARQVAHMRAVTFTSQSDSVGPSTQVAITDDASTIEPDCRTIYVTTPLSAAAFKALVQTLPEGGVLVMYGTWNSAYDEVVRELSRT